MFQKFQNFSFPNLFTQLGGHLTGTGGNDGGDRLIPI